jgi:hypothetical protein
MAITLTLSWQEAKEVREAILETNTTWTPVLDRVTKTLQDKLDGKVN